MQMRTVKLSQIGFGYFSYNPKNDRKENYLLVTKNTSEWIPVVLRAREQLRACVKWDLVDIFIHSRPQSPRSFWPDPIF